MKKLGKENTQQSIKYFNSHLSNYFREGKRSQLNMLLLKALKNPEGKKFLTN